MKKIDNPLHKDFIDVKASCALEAIAWLFDLDKEGMIYLARKAGYHPSYQGPAEEDILRILKLLAATKKKKVIYTRNRKKLSLSEFIKTHRRGWFILNFDGHACAYKNRMLVDGWNPDLWELEGWWELVNKYPKKVKQPNGLQGYNPDNLIIERFGLDYDFIIANNLT